MQSWEHEINDVLWINYKGEEVVTRVAGYFDSLDNTKPLYVNLRVSDGAKGKLRFSLSRLFVLILSGSPGDMLSGRQVSKRWPMRDMPGCHQLKRSVCTNGQGADGDDHRLRSLLTRLVDWSESKS